MMGKNDVAGLYFSISEMSDSFSVMDAVKKIDHSALYEHTSSHMGSVYRGRIESVFDAYKAWFIYMYEEGKHAILTATIVHGDKQDKEIDFTPKVTNLRPNEAKTPNIDFDIVGRFSVYVMGDEDTDDTDNQLLSIDQELNGLTQVSKGEYELRGKFSHVTAYIEQVYAKLATSFDHFAIDLKYYTHSPKIDYHSERSQKKMGITTKASITTSPMTVNYMEVINQVLSKVDNSAVEAAMDDIATTYRGNQAAVFDVIKAYYLHSYKEEQYNAFVGTIRNSNTDQMNQKLLRVNQSAIEDIDFDVIARFSLFPLGIDQYHDVIQQARDEGKNRGLVIQDLDIYGTNLSGSVQDVMDFFEDVYELTATHTDQFAIEIIVKATSWMNHTTMDLSHD
ncbi:YkoF family thiamine/hydroxymethylpyrimidine-binding protein [Dolosigranulum pigrum]|jgi:hypothetical protein|uniref:YkoF family thiamine/hydroxymethylpyrimidine-binding protein n=1 Tax=Dolosigranulum pigrum TaxID=29394 RepID=UPI000DC33EAC|nr:YkoF family thiamine/hydroxymethylpyrimidine-binding protein [Dolosigranulum pigrum]QJS96616.1 hypothetical protein B5772_06715 [Dolosigranulum pigrum]QTJ44228.1 hypothetical protein FE328_00960 [Dolosigranulum pigrum]